MIPSLSNLLFTNITVTTVSVILNTGWFWMVIKISFLMFWIILHLLEILHAYCETYTCIYIYICLTTLDNPKESINAIFTCVTGAWSWKVPNFCHTAGLYGNDTQSKIHLVLDVINPVVMRYIETLLVYHCGWTSPYTAPHSGIHKSLINWKNQKTDHRLNI